MSDNHPSSTGRAYSILILFIALKAVGNLSLALGMKRVPQDTILRVVLDPFVIAGVAALILAVLARMALLSLADLSYVLPVTAIGYIVAVVLGKAFLNESISAQRWTGAVLIAIGAVLVGTGTPRTDAPKVVVE